MAVSQWIWQLSLPAGEDMREFQYSPVYLDSDGTCKVANAGAIRPLGILQNKPNTGEAATIMKFGISKCRFNYAASVGDVVIAALTSADKGQLQVASTSANTKQNVVGTVLVAAGDYGAGTGNAGDKEIGSVILDINREIV